MAVVVEVGLVARCLHSALHICSLWASGSAFLGSWEGEKGMRGVELVILCSLPTLLVWESQFLCPISQLHT